MNLNNRTEERLPLQKKCTLVNSFGFIESQTVEISQTGLVVKTDRKLPLKLKNGCEFMVFIQSMDKLYQTELMWTKKDFNNTTRLGLNILLEY
jgi:hypothetical protein